MQENPSESFNIEDYRLFLNSCIEVVYTRKGSLTRDEVVGYCSQFLKTVVEYFPDKNQSTTSEKLRKMLGSALKDKPAAVAINTFLLFNYGYIRCSVCGLILPLHLFYEHKNTWNGYKHYCINCQKSIRDSDHSKKYIKNNRYKYNAYLAKYRAAKLKATPPWLTTEQLQEIESMYKKAKLENKEVDHIVPLQGKNICGLHVPWNLQLLTRSQNASKGNTF